MKGEKEKRGWKEGGCLGEVCHCIRGISVSFS